MSAPVRVLRDRAPGLHTEALLTDHYAAVYLAGELDLSTAAQVAQAVRACLAQRPHVVRVDVSELAFCDWCGLKALLDLQREAQRVGTVLKLSGTVRRQLARLLDATGTTQMLTAPDAGTIPAAGTTDHRRPGQCPPSATPQAQANAPLGTQETRTATVPKRAVA